LNGIKIEKREREEGDGEIMEEIGEGGEIEIEGSSEIEECKSNEWNGGWMMIILNDNVKIILNGVKIRKNEVNGMGYGIDLSLSGDTQA
jgi:hypothetical protein